MGQSETSPMSCDKAGLWNIKQEDDDELSILAGHTRFVSTRRGTSPPRSIRFEPSPPHYSSPQPLDAQHLSAQQQRQPQQEISRTHPGLAPASYQHRSAALPETSSSSGSSDRWSPSSGSSASCDSYMAPPMDSLHFPYSPAERAHKHSPPAIPSSSSPYGWTTDDLHPDTHQQPPVTSTPSSIYHIHAPTSFASSSSSFSSPSQPDSMFPSQNQQNQPRRHSPPQHAHQPVHQHERYQMVNLQAQHHHAQFPSQYPPELNPSNHLPQQHSHQQYSMYNDNNNAPTTGGYALPPGAPPNMDLADLGLASRDSRLDDRWGSFMADSGLLEDFRQGLNASVWFRYCYLSFSHFFVDTTCC